MGFRGQAARLSELVADLIVGAVFKTAATGERLEISRPARSEIRFHYENPAIVPAMITSSYTGDAIEHASALVLKAPPGPNTLVPAELSLADFEDGPDAYGQASLQADRIYMTSRQAFDVTALGGGFTINGARIYEAPVRGRNYGSVGNATDLPTDSVVRTVYSFAHAVPAGTRYATVSVHTRARSTGGALVSWFLIANGTTIAYEYCHNLGDQYTPLDAALVGSINITSGTLTVTVDGACAAGGNYTGTRPTGYTVTFFG